MLSEKTEKNEYLTSKEILPSHQARVIEQTNFICPPFGKAFEKQKETIAEQGKKQVEALKVLRPASQQLTVQDVISEDQLNKPAINEIEKT